VPERIDLATIDVSFISVKKVIPVVKNFLSAAAELMILIKPEFELPSREVPDGGVIRDREKQRKVLMDIGCFLEKERFGVLGFHKSPKKKASKNDEYFCYAGLERPGGPGSIEDMIHDAIGTV